MNRNDITTLDKLIEGDRFYKFGDRKKIAMQVTSIISNKINGVQTVCIRPTNRVDPLRQNSIEKVYKAKDYQVVFLKHEIDIA